MKIKNLKKRKYYYCPPTFPYQMYATQLVLKILRISQGYSKKNMAYRRRRLKASL